MDLGVKLPEQIAMSIAQMNASMLSGNALRVPIDCLRQACLP